MGGVSLGDKSSFLMFYWDVKNLVRLGGLAFKLYVIRRSWEVHFSPLGDWFGFQLSIIRLYLHVSSSYHTMRDEWWPAAAAAGDSTPIL